MLWIFSLYSPFACAVHATGHTGTNRFYKTMECFVGAAAVLVFLFFFICFFYLFVNKTQFHFPSKHSNWSLFSIPCYASGSIQCVELIRGLFPIRCIGNDLNGRKSIFFTWKKSHRTSHSKSASRQIECYRLAIVNAILLMMHKLSVEGRENGIELHLIIHAYKFFQQNYFYCYWWRYYLRSSSFMRHNLCTVSFHGILWQCDWNWFCWLTLHDVLVCVLAAMTSPTHTLVFGVWMAKRNGMAWHGIEANV